MHDLLPYQLALKKISGVGAARARKLVSYCGGVKEVFEASVKDLANVPDIGPNVAKRMNRDQVLREVDSEMAFIEKRQIQTHFFLDDSYPERLKHCIDAPVMLFSKGQMQMNVPRVINIIGTRDASAYGAKLVERLVEGLKDYNCLIISGLAYGIDTFAHRAAVQNGVQTIGVLGHGLDRVYPNSNRELSEQMLLNGGLLTEFESGTKPDRENFPMRNRIVAGMCDATVVVESGVKGGSLITAKLAMDYNRDVMAFPGPVDAPYSSGCNFLIKSHQAHLIESSNDLAYVLGWEKEEKASEPQKKMFVELSDEEQSLLAYLEGKQRDSLDNLSLNAGMPVSKASTILLELEFKGVVRSLPGKVYSLT